jgi:KH domain
VPRLIGKGGSMIHTITRLTGTKIVVGQNGRIWVDGPLDAIARVRACLKIIDEESTRPGLTEKVEGFLAATGPTDETGPRDPGRRSERRPSTDPEEPSSPRRPPADGDPSDIPPANGEEPWEA